MKPSGAIRLILFFLLPPYLVWLYRMDWNPSVPAWPNPEIVAWVVFTILWTMAWGCAALVLVRNARRTRDELQRITEKRQREKQDNAL